MIFLVGVPGSGKGTQGEILAEVLDAERIITSDVIRSALEQDKVEGYVLADQNAGKLLPDEICNALIVEAIKAVPAGKNIVVDGFPRSVGQAECAVEQYRSRGYHGYILNLCVSRETTLERIKVRKLEAGENGRPDDAPEVVAWRHDIQYHDLKLIAYRVHQLYGMFIPIIAEGSREKVHKHIMAMVR